MTTFSIRLQQKKYLYKCQTDWSKTLRVWCRFQLLKKFDDCWYDHWRAEGGRSERGDGYGHPRQGGIQKVKLQKFKCCS